MQVTCAFVRGRRDEFFAVLQEKLGSDVTLVPCDAECFDDREALSEFNAIISSVPLTHLRDYAQCLGDLEQCVLNAAQLPVVAFIPIPDLTIIGEVTDRGAYDWFAETQSMQELRIVLRRASGYPAANSKRDSQQPEGDKSFAGLFGSSPALQEVTKLACKVAPSSVNLLITGETGTGKELIARAVHAASSRSSAAFVAVACASLPESLIEAELFGHEKGAFTGAVAMRQGRFEAAGEGTIFLDEIGELTPYLQVKLLRVLQERTFERLGSNVSRPMKARLICATHRDLRAMAHAGQFRLDLYYRLNTVQLHMPSLRERPTDILPLARYFMEQYANQFVRRARRFSNAAAMVLQRHDWPGNVRELQHAIERAVLLCDGLEIQVEHLPPDLFCDTSRDTAAALGPFEQEVRSFKRSLIERSLRAYGNNKVRAARALNISRSSLHRLIDELDIGESERMGVASHELPPVASENVS